MQLYKKPLAKFAHHLEVLLLHHKIHLPNLKMNSELIDNIVKSQIGTAWNTSNLHGVDLKKSLVPPQLISVIDRKVRGGTIHDDIIPVWLVLVEDQISQTGYRIVADQSGNKFGLAVKGFPSDEHLVLLGWYGDFLTTFQSM